MIGIVIVAHGQVAEALVEACELIVGRMLKAIESLAVVEGQKPEALTKSIGQAIDRIGNGDGCLVLFDMLDGVSSATSLPLLEGEPVEVLTGANLPMLLHVVMARNKMPNLSDIAKEAADRGTASIALAGRILNP